MFGSVCCANAPKLEVLKYIIILQKPRINQTNTVQHLCWTTPHKTLDRLAYWQGRIITLSCYIKKKKAVYNSSEFLGIKRRGAEQKLCQFLLESGVAIL